MSLFSKLCCCPEPAMQRRKARLCLFLFLPPQRRLFPHMWLDLLVFVSILSPGTPVFLLLKFFSLFIGF